MNLAQEESAIPFAINLFYKGLAVLKQHGDADDLRAPKADGANHRHDQIR